MGGLYEHRGARFSADNPAGRQEPAESRLRAELPQHGSGYQAITCLATGRGVQPAARSRWRDFQTIRDRAEPRPFSAQEQRYGQKAPGVLKACVPRFELFGNEAAVFQLDNDGD
jgi:hypothetical protein